MISFLAIVCIVEWEGWFSQWCSYMYSLLSFNKLDPLMICNMSAKYLGKLMFSSLLILFTSVVSVTKMALIKSSPRRSIWVQKEASVLKPLLNDITGREDAGCMMVRVFFPWFHLNSEWYAKVSILAALLSDPSLGPARL